jgi:RNA polymerase sigma factor (sigma-70 family)
VQPDAPAAAAAIRKIPRLLFRIFFTAGILRKRGENRLPENQAPRDSRAGNREFPSTSWSLVSGLRHASPEVRKKALEGLCARYWSPVLYYVRRAWSKSHEDAKDLTQGFFLELVDGESLRKYAPDRAGFRTYLKMLLSRYSADQNDLRIALKRGGGRRIVPIDDGEAPLRLADPQAEPPDKAFDRAWRKSVLEPAIERTRRHFSETGRGVQFQAFEEYELHSSPEQPTYSQVAERIGRSESDVRNYLFTVREKLRDEILAEITPTVGDLTQLDDEFNSLFGG